jgi:hypothetical protein
MNSTEVIFLEAKKILKYTALTLETRFHVQYP